MAKTRNYAMSCGCTGTCTCGSQGITIQVLPGQGGARGVQGTRGTQGVAGTDGTSVTILGSYNSYAELVAAHPSGSLGDGYIVSGDLYVWEGSSWVNVGNVSGPQGVQGVQGVQGTQGVQGSGVSLQDVQEAISSAALNTTDDLSEGTTNLYFTPARVSYIFTQGTPSATWNITHNLHFHPNVTVKDSGGSIVEGEIAYTNSDSLIVTFSTAFSGEAYLS